MNWRLVCMSFCGIGLLGAALVFFSLAMSGSDLIAAGEKFLRAARAGDTDTMNALMAFGNGSAPNWTAVGPLVGLTQFEAVKWQRWERTEAGAKLLGVLRIPNAGEVPVRFEFVRTGGRLLIHRFAGHFLGAAYPLPSSSEQAGLLEQLWPALGDCVDRGECTQLHSRLGEFMKQQVGVDAIKQRLWQESRPFSRERASFADRWKVRNLVAAKTNEGLLRFEGHSFNQPDGAILRIDFAFENGGWRLYEVRIGP